MPMIDVYAPEDIFPADADEFLGRELTHAVLRAEGWRSQVHFTWITPPLSSTACLDQRFRRRTRRPREPYESRSSRRQAR